MKNKAMSYILVVSVTFIYTIVVLGEATVNPNKPADFAKFMPNPSGHGFDDSGMTKAQAFDQGAQMSRFGVPDLNNPISRELTDLEFEYALEGEKYVAVLFYSHGMQDYEYYALHWEKASMEMSESLRVYTTANITMARFDVSEPEHQEIVEKFQLSKEKPSMKVFYDGKLIADVKSAVMHDDIRQFIIAQTIPALKHLENEEEVRKWKRRKQFNQSNLKFIALFTESKSDAYEEVAKKLKESIQFAYVSTPDLFELATKIQNAKNNEIVLIRDFDEPRIIRYDRSVSVADIVTFVQSYNIPLLTNLGDKEEFRVRDLLNHDLEYRLMVFFKNMEQFEKAKPGLIQVAKDIRSEALVAYSIQDKDDSMNFDYHFWGIPGKDPAFLYVFMRKDRKYIYTGNDAYEPSVMKNFIQKVKNGQVEAKLRSQTPPVQNNGPIQVVVTSSYESDIYKQLEKDSLILFHSPGEQYSDWYLQHLTKFAKVWRREKRLQLASVDYEKNDILSANVTHSPQLFYVKAGEKLLGSLLTKTFLDIKYPDMRQLMEFVKNNTDLSLQMDKKVWDRILKEDDELKEKFRQTTEISENESGSSAPMDDIIASAVKFLETEKGVNEKPEEKISQKENVKEQTSKEKVEEKKLKEESPEESMFSHKFQELKKKVLSETGSKSKPKQAFEGTAGDYGTFPGSLSEIGDVHQVVSKEMKDLLKTTGYTLPDNVDELDTEKIQQSITWYGTMLFFFNMFMVSVFGDGIFGAIIVLFLMSMAFLILPMLLKRRRRWNMKIWLNEFYKSHGIDNLKNVDKIVSIYLELSNGDKKLKEDVIRKHVLSADDKKTK